ncbi:Beta-glucanase precursor [Planctomycetes bacterium MalM25]|nr:Beta-glucanase precursor [Planctomycetes bacterium MalM25]
MLGFQLNSYRVCQAVIGKNLPPRLTTMSVVPNRRWGVVALWALLAWPALGLDPNISGWDRVWVDPFNGSSVNTGRWEVADREFSPNNELQYYHPDQVSVGNGQLTITASNQPLGAQPYRSGLIRTWQEHRYGRWEVRADLPFGKGMWPAIWLLPRDLGTAPWPTGGEIDIMENVGNDTFFVKGSYHYNWTPGSPITSNADYRTGEDFAAGMHDYAVEWDPDQLRFYVDDNLYHVVDNPIQPQEQPMSLIINLAVGGDWPGSPDGSTQFPQTFDIDHAIYWTRDETELINPDFDRSGWGLNGWDVFGNEIDNVTAQTEAALDGTHALKLFGQFNGSQNYSGVAQGIAVTPGQDIVAEANAFVRSEDSIFATDNEVLMKLEYYRVFDGLHGGADFLGEEVLPIADGSTVEDVWASHQIIGVVPDDAVEARVSFLFNQPGTAGGAVHVDAVSLLATDPIPLSGDYNGDGVVDAADYTTWRDGDSVDGSPAGYTRWASNYGAVDDAPLAVPEPAGAVLLTLGLLGPVSRRRR